MKKKDGGRARGSTRERDRGLGCLSYPPVAPGQHTLAVIQVGVVTQGI